MMETAGHPVRELTRIAFGTLRLKGLLGHLAQARPDEVKSLLDQARATPTPPQEQRREKRPYQPRNKPKPSSRRVREPGEAPSQNPAQSARSLCAVPCSRAGAETAWPRHRAPRVRPAAGRRNRTLPEPVAAPLQPRPLADRRLRPRDRRRLPAARRAPYAFGRHGAHGGLRTLTDDTGATLTLAAPPKRIVSLAPSNTEIFFAIGAGDRVVADTESCDYPPEAKSRPHVGGMSAGDLERIQVLLPDLVVAVGSINQKLIAALRAAHIQTLAVQPRTTSDVLASIRLLGKATGQDAEAERIAADVAGRIDKVRATTAKAASRPKTLIVYSDNPIYTSPPDSFIHDLIGVAGGDDIVKTPLAQNIISPAVVVERAPEVIICSASSSRG